jgi:hypothetical protein
MEVEENGKVLSSQSSVDSLLETLNMQLETSYFPLTLSLPLSHSHFLSHGLYNQSDAKAFTALNQILCPYVRLEK